MVALVIAASAAGSDDPPANSMKVEDTSLWEATDGGFFLFHDHRADTVNDPVPDAWNIYGQPLEFDLVRVSADGSIKVDVDPADDSNAIVTSALDPTVRYVIRLSSREHSVTVVHEGDIGDVTVLPENADQVAEFHELLTRGAEGSAVVTDEAPEPQEENIHSMTVEDTSLYEATDGEFFIFHDSRADTVNDAVPDAWNIYGQPLEFDAVEVYADGSVQVDIDTEDDSNAIVTAALDPTITYVIRLSSGEHSVTVVHEGDIGDVKLLPENADEVVEFHGLLIAGSEGTAVVSDESPERPDLEVTAPTASDANPGQGAEFTLSATVTNAGTATSTATTLRYYRSADAPISGSDNEVGTDAVGALAAGGTSAESVALTAPGTAGTYYYGACVDSVSGELDTADNCSSSVRVDVGDVEDVEGPDLEVGTPAVDDGSLDVGEAFTLSATVTNAGSAASTETTLRYYRSADAAIGRSDTEVGRDAVGALAAGGSSAESVVLTAPGTAGTYYYGACVDSVSGESDTTDDCSSSVRVEVAGVKVPDLEVGAPAVDDGSLDAGEAFTLSTMVTNAGTAASAETTLRYYRSVNATISGSDTEVGTAAVGALAAGGSSAESIALTAPATAGTYYFGACVDSVSGESDTTDNCSSSVRVDVGSVEGPDLEVGMPAVDHASLRTGEAFTLSATVTNAGSAASAETALRYYRSADAEISGSDTQVGTDAVRALQTDGASAESIVLTPPGTAGTYYYGACVDAVSGELDTSDNCSSSVRVTVRPPPDLVVVDPEASGFGERGGEEFTFSATVHNRGGGDAAATTLHYYRSPNETISTDGWLVGTDEVDALAATSRSAESIVLVAPTERGAYYYGACVAAVPGESNESNNCSSGVRVTVADPPSHPDLVVTDVSATGSGGLSNEFLTDEGFTLWASVRNRGTGGADPTTLRYYRSTDAGISDADTEVGTDEIPELDRPLGGIHRSSREQIEVRAPSVPGTYYYGGCVDTVPNEVEVSNNCSSSVRVTVTQRPKLPDLEVRDFSLSDSRPGAGDPITLSATVRNGGTADAEETTLRYYRSTDSGISTSDTEVAIDSVEALAPAGDSEETTELTAPTEPGSYYYGACVDAVADESNTRNNCSSSVRLYIPEPRYSDLAVRYPKVSNSLPVAGAAFTFSATVTNWNATGEAAATTLRYYRSTDSTIDRGDTEVASDPIGALAARGSTDQSVTLNAPSEMGARYYYGACVDPVADESNTANNCSGSVPITVLGPSNPDLLIGAWTVDDWYPEADQDFTMSVTVRNRGTAAAGATTLRLYRSAGHPTDSTPDTEVASIAISDIAASASTTESVTMSESHPGLYYFRGCVDSVADESDTTNNCDGLRQGTTPTRPPDYVRVWVRGPELEQYSFVLEPESAEGLTAGNPYRMVGGVINLGYPTPRTTMRFYRSTEPLTAPSEEDEVGTVTVGELRAPYTRVATVRGLIWPAEEGTLYHKVCTDTVPNEVITTNNCREITTRHD